MKTSILNKANTFIASAAHELRTPITILKGYLETLLEVPSLSSETKEEILETMLRGCNRMEHLIKNLLTLADLETCTAHHVSRCDLSQIVTQCKEQLFALHPEAELTIETKGEDFILHADSSLLELALFNLLQNGVKYSPKPAKLTLTLSKRGERKQVTIQDQGLGIPKEDLPHIFERFYRVDKARSRKMGGAGLGLALVKAIVAKHAGKITVSSQEGKGTKFSIII